MILWSSNHFSKIGPPINSTVLQQYIKKWQWLWHSSNTCYTAQPTVLKPTKVIYATFTVTKYDQLTSHSCINIWPSAWYSCSVDSRNLVSNASWYICQCNTMYSVVIHNVTWCQNGRTYRPGCDSIPFALSTVATLNGWPNNSITWLWPSSTLLCSQLNRFCAAQGHCGAWKKRRLLADLNLCLCSEMQAIYHTVKSCHLTNLDGALSRLHSADDDTVQWLANIGRWTRTRMRK